MGEQRKIKEATTAVGELVLHLQTNLENYTGITVSEVVKSGSLGHGTAVQGNFDIDLVVYSRDINAEEVAKKGYGSWTGEVKSFLQRTLRGQVTFGKGTIIHAVRFQYKGIDVDLLVSPYWDEPRDLYEFLRTLRAEERYDFSVSAAKWQVVFFRLQPNQVKEFIKRAKAWRNKTWPRSADAGRPKSYLISLLVVRAHMMAFAVVGPRAKTDVIASKLEKKLDSVSLRTTDQMHYLVNNHKELDVYWESDEYYMREEYPQLLPDPPCIVDPANPANNLYTTGINRCPPKERDKPGGDGNWTRFKGQIGSLDLTKTVEEIQCKKQK